MGRYLRRVATALVGVAAGASALAACGPVPASDLVRQNAFRNTDVAYAGVGGLRGVGSGTIALSGVSGTVTRAFLYWQGPTNSTDPNANRSVTFAGVPVTGTNIGFSSDNCWGFQNSQAYRADVTALVPGNGNYALSNFRKPNAEVNGASLVVFFTDSDLEDNRDVVLFEGNDSNTPNTFDADGWNATLSGIDYSGGPASLDLHVSDGQAADDDAVVVNDTVVAPSGPIFEGASLPGDGSSTNGNLWDIRSFDVTSLLDPGPNSLTLTSGQGGDCLSLIVAAVNLPAGAAPPDDGADVRVSTVDTPDPVTGGENVRYRSTVTNDGPGTATGVTLTDTVPVGTTIVSASSSRGACTISGRTATCPLGAFASGASATVDVIARVSDPPPSSLNNQVNVTSTSSDPDSSDNSTSTTTSTQTATRDRASGFVPPGGSISTGTTATADDPVVSTFRLPNSGSGSTITIQEDPCDDASCSGQSVFIAPFTGGYTNFDNPPTLTITWDASLRLRPESPIYVEKDDGTLPRLDLVTPCQPDRYTPCLRSNRVLANGDLESVIVMLQGDPRYRR